MTDLFERHKLVSLWAMLKFEADKFVSAMAELARIEQLIELAERHFKDHAVISKEAFDALQNAPLSGMEKLTKGNPGILREQLTDLGLTVSAKAADKLIEADQKGLPIPQYRMLLAHIRMSIQSELEGTCLLHVPFNVQSYFNGKELFGADVARTFPSSTLDIEEAGKCFALERYTSSVFHLMRVMEVIVRALGLSLCDPSIDPKKNPTLESILHRCDDELKQPANKRTPTWQKDDQFFSDATANLRSVKVAWRNPTMHVEIDYDEDKARDVYNAVRGFVRHMATRMDEKGNWL